MPVKGPSASQNAVVPSCPTCCSGYRFLERGALRHRCAFSCFMELAGLLPLCVVHRHNLSLNRWGQKHRHHLHAHSWRKEDGDKKKKEKKGVGIWLQLSQWGSLVPLTVGSGRVSVLLWCTQKHAQREVWNVVALTETQQQIVKEICEGKNYRHVLTCLFSRCILVSVLDLFCNLLYSYSLDEVKTYWHFRGTFINQTEGV